MTRNVVTERSLDYQEEFTKSILLKKNANETFAGLANKAGITNPAQLAALKKMVFFFREGKIAGKGIPNDPETLARIGLDNLPEAFRGKDLTKFSDLQKAVKEAGLDEAFNYADNLLENHYEDWLKLINDARHLSGKDKLKAVKSYIQHTYDLADTPALDEIAAKFTLKSKNFNKRTISDMFTAITERGLVPANLDVFDLAQKYHAAGANIVTAETAIHTLRKARFMRNIDGKMKSLPIIMSKRMAIKRGLIQEGWKPIKDLDLARRLGIGPRPFKMKGGRAGVTEDLYMPDGS